MFYNPPLLSKSQASHDLFLLLICPEAQWVILEGFRIWNLLNYARSAHTVQQHCLLALVFQRISEPLNAHCNVMGCQQCMCWGGGVNLHGETVPYLCAFW